MPSCQSTTWVFLFQRQLSSGGKHSDFRPLSSVVSPFPKALGLLHPVADVEQEKRAEGNPHCLKAQPRRAIIASKCISLVKVGHMAICTYKGGDHRPWVGGLVLALAPRDGRRVLFRWKASHLCHSV